MAVGGGAESVLFSNGWRNPTKISTEFRKLGPQRICIFFVSFLDGLTEMGQKISGGFAYRLNAPVQPFTLCNLFRIYFYFQESGEKDLKVIHGNTKN